MKQEIVFKQYFATSQKTSADSGFGLGFNYILEAYFALTPGMDTDQCLDALARAVATVDHKALGVDVNLGFEPTTANLCRYLSLEIKKHYGSGAFVKLIRGDGLAAEHLARR
jgi:hypothetical protein